MGNWESWGSREIWNKELDKQSRYENLGRWAGRWEITGKGRRDAWSRTGNQREGGWDGRLQKARSFGRREKDAELGQCSSGKPMDTGEANSTGEHIGKGLILYSELGATNMAQGPPRDHRR